jgi:protein-S-isoprenylcysteine O-methyltransferase Ste14
MEAFFPVLLITCIITHLVRSTYEVFKFRKILEPSRVSFIIIFINMGLLWASWFVLCGIEIYRIGLDGIVRFAGISVFAIGLFLFLYGLCTMKTLEIYKGDLITHGIYSTIRHPMYLGFILWSIGLPLFNDEGFVLILSIPCIANILFWKYLEEKELEMRFPAYTAYRKRTLF